jgi:hypothetical protein
MEKIITKETIKEIIDSSNNLIGTDDVPQTGPNKETQASKTTDYNAKIHGQNYKNDFLGRFGFYFYESEGQDKPEIVEELEFVVGEAKAKEVMSTIKPFIEEALDSMGGIMSEANVVEDKLTNKKVDNDFVKKDKGDVSDKLKRVADLLDKLPKNELEKLINLLEIKRKK